MTFHIADEVNSKPSSKKMYSSKKQLQTVNDLKSENTKLKDTSNTLSKFSETHLKNNQTNIDHSSHQQPKHLYLDPVYYELDECAAPMTNSNAITSTECDTDQLKPTYPNSIETNNE